MYVRTSKGFNLKVVAYQSYLSLHKNAHAVYNTQYPLTDY